MIACSNPIFAGTIRKATQRGMAMFALCLRRSTIAMLLPVRAMSCKCDLSRSPRWMRAQGAISFGCTILPLPYHAMKDYVLPPTTLEADHAYRMHPEDWRTFQTRYVTPHYFISALRSTQ